MPKVTSKGQVTIPKEIREKLGIKKGDEIIFKETKRGIIIQKHITENPFEKYKGKTDTDETIEEWREKFRIE